ncbi:MAG TPA: cupin domain-containing protein [Acidimicrobiales bacterium]|nr:MAG: hypothetical protein B7Z69_06340 [Actinobacteria bacterium 21-73-9]HQU26018.1 cupin domain-containing protein [Acidimicrobiales bacterium]
MSPEPVPLTRTVAGATGSGVVWTLPAGSGVNVNLVRLEDGEAIAEHVNDVLDVVLVGVSGTVSVSIDGLEVTLEPGALLCVPAGARRAVAARAGAAGYLSLHRERGGLMPRGT